MGWRAALCTCHYPGLLDGIVVGRSFPDVVSATNFTLFDARLLEHYFTEVAPGAFSQDQHRDQPDPQHQRDRRPRRGPAAAVQSELPHHTGRLGQRQHRLRARRRATHHRRGDAMTANGTASTETAGDYGDNARHSLALRPTATGLVLTVDTTPADGLSMHLPFTTKQPAQV